MPSAAVVGDPAVLLTIGANLVAPFARAGLDASRVAQLRLFARRPPHPDQQIDYALEQMADNFVSIVFT
jgi:hypothetical protein